MSLAKHSQVDKNTTARRKFGRREKPITMPVLSRVILILIGSLVLLLPEAAPAGAPRIHLITSYDFPGSDVSYTFGGAIANNGGIAGIVGLNTSRVVGYERRLNGKFSPRIVFPGSSLTSAYGVNSAGVVSGTFSSDADHGFFYDRGSYTQYDVPGAIHTNVTGLNDAGDFCGFYFTDASVITPFLNVGGTLIPFSIPGINVVYARAINNLGEVAGGYVDPADEQVEHGFLREADGTLIYPLDPPNSHTSAFFGLNNNGVLVGTYTDLSLVAHAFLLQLPNKFLSYDFPGGDYSIFRGINDSGFISGDALTDTFHAFIARIR